MPCHTPHTCRRRVSLRCVNEGESSGSQGESRPCCNPRTGGGEGEGDRGRV